MRKNLENEQKSTNEESNISIQATIICDAHLSCCEEKGCPGQFELLPSGHKVWTGRCCF